MKKCEGQIPTQNVTIVKKNTITSSIQSYNEMKHVLISVGPLANRSGYNRT